MRRAPKALGPNDRSGSNVATMVCGSCRSRPPEGARVRTVRSVPSSVSISIWPLRGKRSGLFSVKVNSEESGRSSGFERLILEVFESGMDDLRSSEMTGRGAETTTGTERTRPSRNSIAAVRCSLTWVGGVGAFGGQIEVKGSRGRGVGRLGVVGGIGRGAEDEIAEFDLVNLTKPRAGDDQGPVAGVEFDGGHGGRLGEGAGGELVRLGLLVLLDSEMQIARSQVMLERQRESENVWPIQVCGSGLKGTGNGFSPSGSAVMV